MKKNGILDELPELLNIPQFETIMTHKIEELKLMLKDEIEQQKKIKNTCDKAQDPVMVVCEEEGIVRDTSYRFKLNLSDDGEWIPRILSPSLPPEKCPMDIIPLPLIQYLTRNSSEYFKINKIKEVILPDLPERRFEVSFVRVSHHQVAGSICEFRRLETPVSEEKLPDQPEPNKVNPMIKINDSFKQNPEDVNYRELISYMEQCPEYKDHIFAEFFKKWKFMIDGDNVGVNPDK